MPIYEYKCGTCGVFERAQSIKDDAFKVCPMCGASVERLISRSSFALKGGSWASDGYKGTGAPTPSTSAASAAPVSNELKAAVIKAAKE